MDAYLALGATKSDRAAASRSIVYPAIKHLGRNNEYHRGIYRIDHGANLRSALKFCIFRCAHWGATSTADRHVARSGRALLHLLF